MQEFAYIRTHTRLECDHRDYGRSRRGLLSREAALELARSNGTILCLDVPAQIEFGIDLRSYTVGPRFRGIKMIPTNGLHLVTWGSEMHVCATFVELSASDVSVLRWDAREEALCQVQEVDELQRLVHEVRDMRHDAALGPYPLATQEHWSELSKYISADVLRRAEIPCGVVVEPGGIDAAELEAELERAAAATAAASASSDNTRAAAPPAPRAAGQAARRAPRPRVCLRRRRPATWQRGQRSLFRSMFGGAARAVWGRRSPHSISIAARG